MNINIESMEEKLLKIGAKKIFDRIFRRRVYDYPDLRLHKQGAWIRIRDEGDKATMTFKKRIGIKTHDGTTNDDSMEEIDIIVSDFEKTGKILEKIGLKEKFYEENRRICYRLDDVEIDIDHWPMLEPYLEIEGPSMDKVDIVIKKLGLNPKDKKIFVAYQIYQLKGINEFDYSKITFKEQIKKK